MKQIQIAPQIAGKGITIFLLIIVCILILTQCRINKATAYFRTNNPTGSIYQLYIDSIYRGELRPKHPLALHLKSGRYFIMVKNKGMMMVADTLVLQTGRDQLMGFPSSELLSIEVVMSK